MLWSKVSLRGRPETRVQVQVCWFKIKPLEFAGWNLKLAPYTEGKERLRLAGGRFNKQENWLMYEACLRLVWETVKWVDLHPPARILCLHWGLTWVQSHLPSRWSATPDFFKAASLKRFLLCSYSGQNMHFKDRMGEVPPNAQVQRLVNQWSWTLPSKFRGKLKTSALVANCLFHSALWWPDDVIHDLFLLNSRKCLITKDSARVNLGWHRLSLVSSHSLL